MRSRRSLIGANSKSSQRVKGPHATMTSRGPNKQVKDNLKETLELTKTDAKSKVEKLKKLD